MKESLHPHRKRPTRFLELWEHTDWKVKIYGIRQNGDRPESRFVEIAKGIAAELLPQPAITDFRYGLAFLTVHQAEMFHQIVIDWWERENELRHHVFKAGPETPESFENITATGEAFCVWELAVIGFEREAWLHFLLTHEPDQTGYLNARLNTDV